MSSKIITLNGNLLLSNGSAIQVDVGGGGGGNLQPSKTVDPSTSQQTVTPDTGYDGLEQVVVNAMPSGTAGTPVATKGAVSNNSVSVTPSVTNTTGYITGGTLTGTPVSVSASELVSGSTDITANANNIDVTNLASINVIVKPTLQMGILRPDAEIAKVWSWDAYAVEDWELTIPAYSTTAQTLKATAAESQTYTLDYTNYSYYIIEKMLSIPEYSISTKAKGRVEYWIGTYLYEISAIPGSTYHALIDPSVTYTSRNTAMTVAGYSYKSVYWSSATAITPYQTAAYSVVQTAVAPSITSGVVTINTPNITMRGSTTYFTNTFFDAITDIRFQWRAEMWRAPRGNLNLDGWNYYQLLNHLVDCAESSTHTLT